MSNIFDTTLLDAEQARYVVIAEAAVAGFVVLILGWWMFTPANNKHPTSAVGAPSKFTLVLLWILLAALWVIALVVAALNFSTVAVSVVAALSFFALIMFGLWMYVYTSNESDGCMSSATLLMFAFVAMLACAVCSAGNAATEESRLAAGGMFAAVAGILGSMLVFVVVDANRPLAASA